MNYIYERCKGLDFPAILRRYNLTDLLQNDITINRKIEQTFQTNVDVFDFNFLGNQVARELALLGE